jgi:cell shape-determining protein MreC
VNKTTLLLFAFGAAVMSLNAQTLETPETPIETLQSEHVRVIDHAMHYVAENADNQADDLQRTADVAAQRELARKEAQERKCEEEAYKKAKVLYDNNPAFRKAVDDFQKKVDEQEERKSPVERTLEHGYPQRQVSIGRARQNCDDDNSEPVHHR